MIDVFCLRKLLRFDLSYQDPIVDVRCNSLSGFLNGAVRSALHFVCLELRYLTFVL